jgi:hypothetical protein
MQQPQIAPYPVSDFLQWQGMQQLVLTPKFQRRDVWDPKAKSYLIDTIIRRMPIPPIFLRLRIDASAKRMIREVIDGQQRLRSVLAFISGEFPILAAHNPEFAGFHFNDLPSTIQDEFLAYKFQVNTLENITDADVLRVFARLNTYTQPLVGQELLNAEFFGSFKQTIFDMALDHYTFWTSNNILTDRKIARMADAEFTSEIVISMLDGIRQTKRTDLRTFYEKYDDEFPQAGTVRHQFDEVIDAIGDIFQGNLRNTPFRRIPLFYSLFLAIYDAKYHLPKSDFRLLGGWKKSHVKTRVANLIEAMQRSDPPQAITNFVELSAKATADVGRRQRRHTFLMEYLFQ